MAAANTTTTISTRNSFLRILRLGIFRSSSSSPCLSHDRPRGVCSSDASKLPSDTECVRRHIHVREVRFGTCGDFLGNLHRRHNYRCDTTARLCPVAGEIEILHQPIERG